MREALLDGLRSVRVLGIVLRALPILVLLSTGAVRIASAQSCGELGGDYCSQSGGCPSGYNSLGGTWDCNPCCQSVPQGPSCGEAGGDWCSQSGGCPSGYNSLGQTWDCHPCCRQAPPPPPPPPPPGRMSFSVYSDHSLSWSGDATVYGYSSVIDNSSGCSHSNYSTTTRLLSPSGRQASSTSPGLSSSAGLVFGGEAGQWQVVTTGQYYCSCGQTMAGFSGGVPFAIAAGRSSSCWLWTGQTDYDQWNHLRCVYTEPNGNTPGCARCVPAPGVPKIHFDQYGYCPVSIDWEVYWFEPIPGPVVCAPGGEGRPATGCICADWVGW